MRLDWNKNELHLHISKLLDKLVNVAQADRLITEEEEAIIEGCRAKLWEGVSQFEEMVDNEFDNVVLKEKLQLILTSTLKLVTDTAKIDGKIDPDELKLIETLNSFIRENDITKFID